MIEEENPPVNTAWHYGPLTVGPDGAFVPGHVYYCLGGWTIGPFDPSVGVDTPGAANPCPFTNVAIDKTGPATANPGDNVTYTLSFSVTTATPAAGGYISDTLPADVAYVTYTLSPAVTHLFTPTGQTLQWAFNEDLVSGTQYIILLTCAVDPGASGVLTNYVSIDSTLNLTDTDDSNWWAIQVVSGCIPADITNVTSNSPVELGNPIDFVATVVGTEPINVTWDYGDGVAESGVGMYAASHTYAAAGVYTVTVTAENECGLDTFQLAVEVEPSCVALTGITISGPVLAGPGTYMFTTSYNPPDADPPIVYLWDDSGTLDVSERTFAVTGTYILWVEASNCGGAAVVTDDHTIEITVADFVVDAPAYTESVYAIAVVPIQITNMGSSTETYGLTFSGNNWDAFLSAVSVTLAAGESATVDLTVEFPPDAGVNVTDSLDLSVTPQGGGAPFYAALTVDTACRFDFDGNTLMDMTDVVIMLIEWGGANPFFDINHNGGVDLADLVIALDRFGQGCF